MFFTKKVRESLLQQIYDYVQETLSEFSQNLTATNANQDAQVLMLQKRIELLEKAQKPVKKKTTKKKTTRRSTKKK